MRKKLKPSKDKTTSTLEVGRTEIFSFTEKPSNKEVHKVEETEDKLEASDLFSLFTADIIKEDKVFTR